MEAGTDLLHLRLTFSSLVLVSFLTKTANSDSCELQVCKAKKKNMLNTLTVNILFLK